MLELNILLTLIAAYFTKSEYDNQNYSGAVLWAILLGWDIHSTLAYL